VALKFKEWGIKIDKLYTSAFIRALETSRIFLEHYDPSIEVELFLDIHEKGGNNMKGKCYPGVPNSEALRRIPNLSIPEGAAISEEGWWFSDHVETNEECMTRVKKVLKVLKEMAPGNEGKTFMMVSHGGFLNNLCCLLTGQAEKAGNDPYIPENNSMTILEVPVGEESSRVKMVAYNLKCGEKQ